MDAITVQRLKGQLGILPKFNAYAQLWSEVWEACRKEKGIDLHTRLPQSRLLEIDVATMTLLNEWDMPTSQSCDDPAYRRFIVGSALVCWSNFRGEWIQAERIGG